VGRDERGGFVLASTEGNRGRGGSESGMGNLGSMNRQKTMTEVATLEITAGGTWRMTM